MGYKVPREQIPWYPTIDVEKCTGCRTCFEFCSHGTYGWDDSAEKPVVENPFNCVVGCSGCAPAVPEWGHNVPAAVDPEGIPSMRLA